MKGASGDDTAEIEIGQEALDFEVLVEEEAEEKEKPKKKRRYFIVPSIMKTLESLSSRQSEELEGAELNRRFEDTTAQDSSNGGGNKSKVDDPASETSEVSNGSSEVTFTDEPDFQYVDFVNREDSSKYPTMRINEFNWNSHGYTTLEQLFGSDDLSQLLDSKFRIIKNLTYMTIGKYTSVDTSMFRLAVTNYIQCLFGIRHDDYDYGQVNLLLPR